MNIDIKATGIELTPAIREYAEEKIGSLQKFLKRWELEGEVKTWVELDRTTHHHHKGMVFRAVADLRLPGKILRAEEYNADLRAAIDRVKDTLKREIAKYKDLKA